MKGRGLVVVAVALLAAVLLLLTRGIGGGPPPVSSRSRPRPARTARPASASLGTPTRNVFEYAARPTPAPIARPAPPVLPSPSPVFEEAVPAAPTVRLVGLVRRAGVLRAALQVHGETIVVGAGEPAGDYRVVSIDEDGVRLRAVDGTTITLPAGGS